MNFFKNSRRKFLATGLSTALGAIGVSKVWGQSQAESVSPTNGVSASEVATLTAQTAMPRHQLGRTEVSLPILGLGGAGQTPLSTPNAEAEAVEQIQTALELGIRYFDTAAGYGPSESYLGKVLPPHRDEIFLASKTAARDRDGAWRQLERSLQRLNTDYLDLWQLHHVSLASDLERLFGPEGAIQALDEARAQGVIRFSGITGHHEPEIIAEGLRRYPFDHALIPVNAADAHHPRPFIPSVLPLAREQNIGITAMKVPAYGRLLKPGVLEGMHEALGYALSQPGVHCAIVAAKTVAQLQENVRVARTFQPLDTEALAELEHRTATVWQDSTFFRAWT